MTGFLEGKVVAITGAGSKLDEAAKAEGWLVPAVSPTNATRSTITTRRCSATG